VIGTSAFTLLHQAKEVEQGFSGEFCARQRRVAQAKVGGRQGDAQTHLLAVSHDDVASRPRTMADGEDAEAPPEERVGRFGHLDLFGIGRRRVLEGGIMLVDRSTIWIMVICELFSDFGCVTVCCCA
jgi:hypothetical protein